MIFVCPLPFGIIDHIILTAMKVLRFDLAAPNWRTEVLFLILNISVNRQSDFLALGIFTVTEGPGDI